MTFTEYALAVFIGAAWVFILLLAWAIDRLERHTGIKP